MRFEDWWKRLQALVIRADTVVFAISPDAVGSDQALREVEYAASLNSVLRQSCAGARKTARRPKRCGD
jgi:hypothetical protein